MKQNSKEKYWQEVEARNYVAVMDADPELVTKLFDLARGNMSLERFLHACKLSGSCITNLVYGGTRHIHVKDIYLVMQHLPEASPVTEELLLAANGLYRKKDTPVSMAEMQGHIEGMRKKIRSLNEPAKRTNMGKTKRLRKRTTGKVVMMPNTDNTFSGYGSYEEFIDDMAFYGKRQPDPVLFFLKENQKKLYADRHFCKALALYRKYATAEKEQRVSAFKEFYATGTDMPESISLSGRYKLILDTFVTKGGNL